MRGGSFSFQESLPKRLKRNKNARHTVVLHFFVTTILPGHCQPISQTWKLRLREGFAQGHIKSQSSEARIKASPSALQATLSPHCRHFGKRIQCIWERKQFSVWYHPPISATENPGAKTVTGNRLDSFGARHELKPN